MSKLGGRGGASLNMRLCPVLLLLCLLWWMMRSEGELKNRGEKTGSSNGQCPKSAKISQTRESGGRGWASPCSHPAPMRIVFEAHASWKRVPWPAKPQPGACITHNTDLFSSPV